MTALTEVIIEEGYNSTDELMRDWALMVALTRVDQYQAECEFFEQKYGVKYEEFERQVHANEGYEDFEHEEDLDDWEFSTHALKWWQGKAEELHRAANA
ncbi:MAG: hypothetical protein AB1801_25660 [Chloroflexota bacterium]